MRPNLHKMLRGCSIALAFVVMLVFELIFQSATCAQTASIDQLPGFDDPAPPYSVAQFSGWNEDDYSMVPAEDSSAIKAVYFGGSGGAFARASDSSSFVQLSIDYYGNGGPSAIVAVDRGAAGVSQLSNFAGFPGNHSFGIAFDQVGVAQQYGARTFGVGGVVWIYDESGARPDSDQIAAEHTQLAVENRGLGTPSTSRQTTTKATSSRATQAYQHRLPYSQTTTGHQGAEIGILYGYHEFDMFDQFAFVADGGILGRTYSDTRTRNWVSGPFSGLVAQRTMGPFNFYGHALAVLGLNNGNIQQVNGIGTELIPGAVNRLLYSQPTYSEHRMSITDVSPTGVLWAEAELQITEQSSLKFAWTATYVNNILVTQDRVRFYLPDMGFRDTGEQDFLQQFFYCGIEVVR